MGFLYYLVRSGQILWACLKHLGILGMDRLRGREGLGGARHLRAALEEMSGSFLKFGQILSLQVDLLPRAYCDVLLDLLDRVPPFPFEQVKQVFDEELGYRPGQVFAQFDPTPIAAASIGQVHRATLKDGTVVAVKVQRPGIQETFRRDGVLMDAFVKLVFWLRIRSLFFMRDPVQEFQEWIQDELDYRKEARYAELLRKNSLETPTEHVPRVYRELTTTRILTMDFLEGYSVREYLRLQASGDAKSLEELNSIGFDSTAFVSNVITNFVSDALHYGLFHADLHPANLLILKDNVVGYVDFGIVGSLSLEARRKVLQLTLSYVGGRTEDIYASFLEVCTVTEEADLETFRMELQKRVHNWYREPAIGGVARFRKSLTLAMVDLLTMCRSYGLLPHREMIRYIRALFLTDGLVSRLSPGLDLSPQLTRLCEDYLSQEAQGKLLSSQAALPLLVDLVGWLQKGPSPMLRVLDLLERRQLQVEADIVETPTSRRDEGRRGKVLWAALVWVVVLLVLQLERSRLWDNLWTPPGVVVVVFFVAWTIWLFQLLRRWAGP